MRRDRWNPPVFWWRAMLVPVYISHFSYRRWQGCTLWCRALYVFGLRVAMWNVREKETTT